MVYIEIDVFEKIFTTKYRTREECIETEENGNK